MKRLLTKMFLLCILLTGAVAAKGQKFPSVKEIISLNQGKSYAQIVSAIKKYGYKKFKTIEGTEYWCKNCQVEKDCYPSGELKSILGCHFKIGVASSIELYKMHHRLHLNLNVYSKNSFTIIVKQIKALGYRGNGDDGGGTQAQIWTFSKPGCPTVGILDDYLGNYSLSVD